MLSDFFALFFPRFCAACDQALVQGEEIICLQCDYRMARTDSLSDNNSFVAKKFYGRVELQYVWAYYLFHKKGRIQNLIHRLKYDQMPEIGELVGRKMGNDLLKKRFEDLPDLIIPVPLHRIKLRKRGYNQSEHFGTGLSTTLKVPMNANALIRATNTESQTRKSRMLRWKNVHQIFSVPDMQTVHGRRVLLVDDVITTGSTLESCALTLLEAGATSVSVAAMAAAR